jgi:phytoene dehydrogenase-like protein
VRLVSHHSQVVIVGGGLSGLAAAAYLARAGLDVQLVERARSVGGRAATLRRGGFSLNLGPHALFHAAAREVLNDLGVAWTGGKAPLSGGLAYDRGILHTLPVGVLSLLSTDLLRLGAKLEAGRLLSRLPSLAPEELDDVPLARWLDEHTRAPAVRKLVEALIRVGTYTDDPERVSAGAALRQLQSATRHPVSYVDGGWQTLVDGLRAVAVDAGARIRTGAAVRSVLHDGHVRGVQLEDGGEIAADAVVLAGSPALARRLVPESPSLARAATAAITVEAACLDLALTSLPQPRHLFALGLDCPLYLSVHSASANLARPGAAVVHVAKYLRPGAPTDPRADEHELEALVDLAQPGWRTLVAERRYLPRMAVYHHLPLAASGGLAGRSSPSVEEVTGLFVAGDWVGPTGLLADAGLASARACAKMILDVQARPMTRSAREEPRAAGASL